MRRCLSPARPRGGPDPLSNGERVSLWGALWGTPHLLALVLEESSGYDPDRPLINDRYRVAPRCAESEPGAQCCLVRGRAWASASSSIFTSWSRLYVYGCPSFSCTSWPISELIAHSASSWFGVTM
jgi:hypothetical protein